jgi:hypothetical protein
MLGAVEPNKPADLHRTSLDILRDSSRQCLRTCYYRRRVLSTQFTAFCATSALPRDADMHRRDRLLRNLVAWRVSITAISSRSVRPNRVNTDIESTTVYKRSLLFAHRTSLAAFEDPESAFLPSHVNFFGSPTSEDTTY